MDLLLGTVPKRQTPMDLINLTTSHPCPLRKENLNK
jgi:hypothetical protein